MLVKGDSLPWPGSSLWPLKHRGLPCPARELSSLYLTLSGEYLYVCMTDLPLMWPLAQSPTEASPCCSYGSSTYARNFRIGMCCFMQIRCYSGLCPHPYIAPHSEINLCCLTETFTQKGISSVSPVVQSSLSRFYPSLPGLVANEPWRKRGPHRSLSLLLGFEVLMPKKGPVSYILILLSLNVYVQLSATSQNHAFLCATLMKMDSGLWTENQPYHHLASCERHYPV